MQSNKNLLSPAFRHLPIHAGAVLAFFILLTQIPTVFAVAIVTTAYGFWVNSHAYWRICFDTPPSEWRSGDAQFGYGFSVLALTLLFHAAAPLGIWFLTGGNVLYTTLIFLLANLSAPFYAYRWDLFGAKPAGD